MIKALIVEDEVAARENLIAILTKVVPEIIIVGQTESITQTVRWLSSNDSPNNFPTVLPSISFLP